MNELPLNVFSGKWGNCHCQGITVDTKGNYMYYSFTTKLIKTDLQGKIIGSVNGIMGHLGCIDFNDRDGKVYASLEYKNDNIGREILDNLDAKNIKFEDSFYIAIFDVDKITELDMSADSCGIMKVVYLKEVVDDYNADVENCGITVKHRYGCSGIDGLAIGPDFGKLKGSKYFLFVCYGIYNDVNRNDNNYQVILQFDIDNWGKYAKSINQYNMHYDGPAKPDNKYFIYTGNTTFGIQNLEYDEYTDKYFMAVYKGAKEEFTNFSMFIIDRSKEAVEKDLKDYKENALVLSLANMGQEGKNNIYGSYFMYGSTGMYSFGNGYYYFSHNGHDGIDQFTNVKLYKYVGGTNIFELI